MYEETSKILEKTLSDYGFDVTFASERLASFRAVENTYISTFQSLGGLGILLGTFGLALVLLRNIIERRGELATLRAFRFQTADTLTNAVFGKLFSSICRNANRDNCRFGWNNWFETGILTLYLGSHFR